MSRASRCAIVWTWRRWASDEDAPVYELQPVGRVMRGMDAARRYYAYFFASFRPLVRARSRASERRASDARSERSERRTKFGERLYASERLLRLMFGPAYELTEPL